ncbi:MAG: hypothetical protein IPK64_21755 [bacterium]|nr:hypothetical protein [bacterium]
MHPYLFWLGALLSSLARHPPAPALRRAASSPPARNAGILAVVWVSLYARHGEFWAAFLTALLVPYLPWRARATPPVPSAAPAAPFDEAAFVSALRPLPDADLRRMADGIAQTLQGPVSERDRQDLSQQRRLLYRTLDERRAARRANGSAPPRKGP